MVPNNMTIDLTKCEICTPTGQRALHMYEKLLHLFPYDRPVYSEIMEKGKKFYTMTNYALFKEEEFVGNVGLYPVSVWYDSKPLELIGIGAVATVPQYRRQGVAKYLLDHCVKIIDKAQKPSMLFTGNPRVYEKHGFDILEQKYFAINSADMNFDIDRRRFKYFETISTDKLQVMAIT